MTDANQIYGTFGGTPSEKPALTSGAKPFGVSASPNTFGAQVGEARQQEGAAYRDVGQKSTDYALKYTGMVNDTMANQKAEEYMIKLGEAEEQLKSKKGLQASQYMPEYIDTITKARAEMRNGMPMGAAMSFDSLTKVPEGYAITNGHSYAGSQAREANYKVAESGAKTWAYQMLRGDVAKDPAMVGYGLASIEHNVNKMALNQPGVDLNPNTGMVEFAKTPEGQLAKENTKRELEKYIGDAHLNRFSTLTETMGVEKAYEVYKESKDTIPPATQSQLEAYFVPKVRDAKIRGVTGSIMEDARATYYNSVSSPEAVKQTNLERALVNTVFAQESSSGTDPNVSWKIVDGKTAVGDMQITPDTWDTWKNLGIVKPGEDITNPTDNHAAGARALKYYLAQYSKESPPAEASQRALVAYFSGPGNVAPAGSPQAWVNDAQDKNGQTVSGYVSDTVQRMDMKSSPSGEHIVGGKPLTSMPTLADDFMAHYDDYQRLGQEFAEKQFPGDPDAAKRIHDAFERDANDIIQQQKVGDFMSKQRAFQAVGGMLSKGQKPTSWEQLENISPEVKESIERIRMNDHATYDTIEKNLTENSRGTNKDNSANYFRYLNLMISGDEDITESTLHGLLGRTDGTGINMKDYQDLLEARGEVVKADGWTDELAKQVHSIKTAGGNTDGQAEKRALAFIKMANIVKGKADEKGIAVTELVNPASQYYIGNLTGNFLLSREQQIRNAAKAIPSNAPKVGEVVMGRQYLGGDVHSPQSWGPKQ